VPIVRQTVGGQAHKELRGGLNCPAALPISRDGGT
jgi:hypothetical protein